MLQFMTHDVLETAIREGIPFAIKLADGRQYEVRARDRVILAGTRIVLVDEKTPLMSCHSLR